MVLISMVDELEDFEGVMEFFKYFCRLKPNTFTHADALLHYYFVADFYSLPTAGCKGSGCCAKANAFSDRLPGRDNDLA